MRLPLVLLWLLSAAAASAAEKANLTLGVRVDAAPFAFKVPAVPAPGNASDSARQGDCFKRFPCSARDPGPIPRLLGENETLRDHYGGYIVDVCDDVIADLRAQDQGMRFGIVEVTAASRFKQMDKGNIDVLCDPASITRDRSRKYLASVPVYLSGISFASHPSESLRDQKYAGCMYPVAVVDQTTADASGALTIAETGEWSGGMRDDRKPSLATLVKGYLRGGRNGDAYGDYASCSRTLGLVQTLSDFVEVTLREQPTAPDAVRQAARELDLEPQLQAVVSLDEKAMADANNPQRKELTELLAQVASEASKVLPVKTYESHADAAKDFCTFKVRYYVGDIEIINHALAAAGCRYADASLTYTDERYAIYIRMPRTFGDGRYAGDAMHFLRALSARVYDENSVLIDAYRATFPKITPTRQLQALIWSLSGDFPQ